MRVVALLPAALFSRATPCRHACFIFTAHKISAPCYVFAAIRYCIYTQRCCATRLLLTRLRCKDYVYAFFMFLQAQRRYTREVLAQRSARCRAAIRCRLRHYAVDALSIMMSLARYFRRLKSIHYAYDYASAKRATDAIIARDAPLDTLSLMLRFALTPCRAPRYRRHLPPPRQPLICRHAMPADMLPLRLRQRDADTRRYADAMRADGATTSAADASRCRHALCYAAKRAAMLSCSLRYAAFRMPRFFLPSYVIIMSRLLIHGCRLPSTLMITPLISRVTPVTRLVAHADTPPPDMPVTRHTINIT